MARNKTKITIEPQQYDEPTRRNLEFWFPEQQKGGHISLSVVNGIPVIEPCRLDEGIEVRCAALFDAEKEIKALRQEITELKAKLAASGELSDDDLWNVARIEVLGEKICWADLDPKDAAFYAVRSSRANEDDRYPGIIECQIDNYNAGMLE